MRKYLVMLRVGLRNTMAYRTAVAGRLCMYTAFILIFFSLWRDIYQGGGVEGLTLNQMLWYLCMTELCAFACRSNVFRQMNDDIKNGSIAYQLNRPMNYGAYHLLSSLGDMAFSFVVFGALAVVLGLITVGPLTTFRLESVPFVLLSVLLSIVINFHMMLALGLTAFVWEENTAVILIHSKLLFILGVFVPVEFLPAWAQTIAKCLPYSYVGWAPAKLLVAFDWQNCLNLLAGQVFWAVTLVLLSNWALSGARRALQINGG